MVRENGNLVEQITDETLSPFMTRASWAVQVLFSDYTDIETDLGGGDPELRSKRIQMGETLLALSYALPVLNQRASVEGGFVQSIGFNDSETRLYTPNQIMELASYYKKEAYNEMSAYIDADAEEIDQVLGSMGFEII
jgi:hypothetical protein